MSGSADNNVPFRLVLLPVLGLLAIIGYGLILRPLLLGSPALPLEVVFMAAAALAVAQVRAMGFSWAEIQRSIVKRLAGALPAFFILLLIGVVIGAWMVCGTIPMLVHYGLRWIDPRFLYLLAFAVPALFSTLTGTSWGSAGSVGIVMMGIAGALEGNLGITAGAVVGGAYFGDKLSPLSDSTNMAAIATDVNLFDHIRSMLNTTVPSAVVASIGFLVLGFVYTPASLTGGGELIAPVLSSLSSLFRFNPLLLAPPAVILFGSLRRKPPLPTMGLSILCAVALALIFQRFSPTDVAASLQRGFTCSMAPWAVEIPVEVQTLVERGGIYALIEAIVVAFTVFFFIGAIDVIDAMPRVVERLFGWADSARGTILASLFATAVTNATTSNQYATSFIVGDAFKRRYDALGIPRKVLSRSLEDTGTMLESIIPWTPTAVFMVTTLGVSFAEYWHWQLLSLVNLVVAPTLALLGIGCFLDEKAEDRRGPGGTAPKGGGGEGISGTF